MLKVNGVKVASPSELRVRIFDVGAEPERTANGGLTADRVAVKRALSLRWAALSTAQMGALLGAVSFGVSLAWVMVSHGARGALPVLALGAAQAYGSLFFVGLLTTVSCWKRIDATPAQKIGYCFTFPLFLFTYSPIALGALVRKRQWKPIDHHVAVPVGAMRRSA